jgi:hypothetical protein
MLWKPNLGHVSNYSVGIVISLVKADIQQCVQPVYKHGFWDI